MEGSEFVFFLVVEGTAVLVFQDIFGGTVRISDLTLPIRPAASPTSKVSRTLLRHALFVLVARG